MYKMCFQCQQDGTVEEAVEQLRSNGCLQPCLFRIGEDRYYVKCDNTAIPLTSASCFVEAVEYLFFCFWVFDVQYPAPLGLFYKFIEQLVGVSNKKNSAVLRDVFRALNDVGQWVWVELDTGHSC